MVAAAEAVPQVAAVGFTYRRSPGDRGGAAPARAWVDLGRVSHFNGRYWCDYACSPDGPDAAGATAADPGSGALADLGTHLVDLAETLCGPIESVRGTMLTTFIGERAVPLGTVVGHVATAVSDVREPVENEDVVAFTARFASGATGTFSISRVAYGLPNSLGFELFGERGATRFDIERPGEFGFVDGNASAATAGFRQVFVGPEHPYLADALPMVYRSVGYSQNDLFVFQARAFLEQVVGIERPAALCDVRRRLCATSACSTPSSHRPVPAGSRSASPRSSRRASDEDRRLREPAPAIGLDELHPEGSRPVSMSAARR